MVVSAGKEGRMDVKDKAIQRLRKVDVGDKFSHLLLRKASILIPLIVKDGKLWLLFTVRSTKLRRSPGDVCFPGGRSDPTDADEIATALREAKEEVGVDSEQAEVICRLVPVIDRTFSLVTPVVAFIEDTFQARPNPEEVSDVFLVPLDYFIHPSKYEALPSQRMGDISFVMHTFEYDDPEHKASFRIWGLTAHFAVMVAVTVLGERPTFAVEYDIDNLIASAENNLMEIYDKGRSKL